MLRPNPLAVPRGLRIVEMKDRERGTSYLLAFSEQHSDYESWITNLGGPDENARLLMQLLRGGGTLVDVGANIGTISAPVAASGSAVIAIEMNPTNCLKLWAVATANGFKDFHIVQAAASDYDGMITFQGDEAWGKRLCRRTRQACRLSSPRHSPDTLRPRGARRAQGRCRGPRDMRPPRSDGNTKQAPPNGAL